MNFKSIRGKKTTHHNIPMTRSCVESQIETLRPRLNSSKLPAMNEVYQERMNILEEELRRHLR